MQSLRFGERFVHDHTARCQRITKSGEEIALKIAGHEQKLELLAWKRMVREVSAPAADEELMGRCALDNFTDRIEFQIDAECAEA